MKAKCSCGKIINCEPNGNCWCKQLKYKIQKYRRILKNAKNTKNTNKNTF